MLKFSTSVQFVTISKVHHFKGPSLRCSVPRFQRSLPALRQMTSDSTAFIHQSQLPLPCTQPSSTSAALTAMVLRPPLSTTTTASTRTPVVTLTQSPHCKAGSVSPLLQRRGHEPLTRSHISEAFGGLGDVPVGVFFVPLAVWLMLSCLPAATQIAPQQQGATVRPQVTLAQPSLVALRGQPQPRIIMSQPQVVKQLQGACGPQTASCMQTHFS